MTAADYAHDNCAICKKRDYVRPLHGDKGGPLCCLLCQGKWHAEHGRRRRFGRIVIRALAVYFKNGGKKEDVWKLKLAAEGRAYHLPLDVLGYLNDTAETNDENVDLTAELLADALQLTHPDHHPPERKELAQRVTQRLLDLKPFVFPELKLEPQAEDTRVTDIDQGRGEPEKEPLQIRRPSYPCPECSDTIPFYYCEACRDEWRKRQQKERDEEAAKRRAWYARRKERLARLKPPTTCASCRSKFKSKRKDARFCCDNCRQRAHRKSVTAKNNTLQGTQLSRDVASVMKGAS
jgi:hypothetical protein